MSRRKRFVSDSRPELSAASQVAHKSFSICKINDPGYVDCLLDICLKNNISLIIPTLDTELLLLSKNQKKFSLSNVQIVISKSKLNNHEP
ncbi:MAG: hypothetical protein ACO3VF_04265 [Tamlana sp.]